MECSTSKADQNYEKMAIALPVPHNCQICDQPAHGQHFGAWTCRACAAFFRRCHFSRGASPKCLRLKSKCEPDKNGRWNCKKCRLDKCIAHGMETTNIQYDRDSFRSSESFLKKRMLPSILTERVPVTVESVLGAPHYICFLQKKLITNQSITFIDMSKFAERISDLMREDLTDRSGLKRLSNLELLTRGLEHYRSSQNKFLAETTLVTKETAIYGWEHGILTAANWLNYSAIIRNLPFHLRMELLQSTWMVWTKLERIAMTAEMRVNRQCGKNQFVVSHENLIDYGRMKADLSWWSPYTFDELEYLFNLKDLFFDELVWEIIEIQPDPVELTYLLCSLSFGLAANRVSEELQEFVEQFRETLANDLHDYYARKNKAAYSLRIRQLMKVYQKFVRLRNARSAKYHICAILGVFQSHISNEEYFKVAC